MHARGRPTAAKTRPRPRPSSAPALAMKRAQIIVSHLAAASPATAADCWSDGTFESIESAQNTSFTSFDAIRSDDWNDGTFEAIGSANLELRELVAQTIGAFLEKRGGSARVLGEWV